MANAITRPYMTEAPFADVLSGAQLGEAWAFDRLFAAWNGPITGFVRSRGVRDVDGVVNDVFLKAFTRIDTFDGDESGFRAWLFRIARNRVVDEFRRIGRSPVTVAIDGLAEPPGGDVVDDAERHLGADRVAAILGILTDEQREVLTLRIVADLTIDQIAAITGRRRGAVKQLQRRALRRLEAHLEEPDESEAES